MMEELLKKVKQNLILEHDEDNDLLTGYITAAFSYAESYQHIQAQFDGLIGIHPGFSMNYRERLRKTREEHELTQAEVGAIINKSQQGYNHIEAGRAELKIEDLVKLCRFYELSADYITGLTDQAKSYK